MPDLPEILRRPFFRGLAGDRPDLFRAILRFNAPDPDPDYPDLAKGSGRVRARLLGTRDEGFWDFEEEARRLALLDGSTFERLILHWGAAFCAPRLNRMVLRTELTAVSDQIGPKLLAFARGRGRFSLGDLSLSLKDQDTAGLADLAVLVPRCGLRAYRICSASWPEGLKGIQEKKLKAVLDRYPDPPPPQEAGPADARAVWFSMKKILLKEVAPEWTPCFS